MQLIHYGSLSFDKKKFKKVKNSGWIKPIEGGLWTSPIDSNWGWSDWCKAEDFRKCDKDIYFIIELNKNSNILEIDSLQDLKEILKENYTFDLIQRKVLNFEKLAEKYDAIWLTERGQINTKFSTPNLYGWDCESILIMNSNCFKEIE